MTGPSGTNPRPSTSKYSRASPNDTFTASPVPRAALVDAQHAQEAAQAHEDGDADAQVDDLVVGEVGPQPGEELVVHRRVVEEEALGELDGELLPRRVLGPFPVLGDVGVQLLGESLLHH